MCASPADGGRVSPSPSVIPRAFSRVCNVASPCTRHLLRTAPLTLLRRCQPSPPRACATLSLRLCRPPAIKPVLRPRAHAAPDACPTSFVQLCRHANGSTLGPSVRARLRLVCAGGEGRGGRGPGLSLGLRAPATHPHSFPPRVCLHLCTQCASHCASLYPPAHAPVPIRGYRETRSAHVGHTSPSAHALHTPCTGGPCTRPCTHTLHTPHTPPPNVSAHTCTRPACTRHTLYTPMHTAAPAHSSLCTRPANTLHTPHTPPPHVSAHICTRPAHALLCTRTPPAHALHTHTHAHTRHGTPCTLLLISARDGIVSLARG